MFNRGLAGLPHVQTFLTLKSSELDSFCHTVSRNMVFLFAGKLLHVYHGAESQLLYSRLDHISAYYLAHSAPRRTCLTASTLSHVFNPSRLIWNNGNNKSTSISLLCRSVPTFLCQSRSKKQQNPLIAYYMRR